MYLIGEIRDQIKKKKKCFLPRWLDIRKEQRSLCSGKGNKTFNLQMKKQLKFRDNRDVYFVFIILIVFE